MPEHTIRLNSELTIRDIQPLFAQLSERLTHDEDLHIDASQLSMLDTAGAQLLYLFAQTCASRSLRVNWLDCQPEFKTYLQDLGMHIPELTFPESPAEQDEET